MSLSNLCNTYIKLNCESTGMVRITVIFILAVWESDPISVVLNNCLYHFFSSIYNFLYLGFDWEMLNIDMVSPIHLSGKLATGWPRRNLEYVHVLITVYTFVKIDL